MAGHAQPRQQMAWALAQIIALAQMRERRVRQSRDQIDPLFVNERGGMDRGARDLWLGAGQLRDKARRAQPEARLPQHRGAFWRCDPPRRLRQPQIGRIEHLAIGISRACAQQIKQLAMLNARHALPDGS